MELNKIDDKLLGYLSYNAREPSTRIAKATGLTREQVEYRIKKYISSGIIKNFTTLFNPNAFGYKYYSSLLIKFSKPIHAKEFFEKHGKDSNTLGIGKILNEYNISMELFFKNKEDFRNYLNKILNEQKEKISNYLTLDPYFAKLYPLKFLGVKEKGQGMIFNPEIKEISLDKNEIKIVKMLEKDGRERIVDIASALKISPELTIYKIKRLYEKNVILSSAAIFDMKKLGYFLSSILINIQNFSKENEEKIKSFAEKSKQVRSVMLLDSKPNCFMQLFHKEHSELIKTLKELKELFDKDIIEIKVLFLESEMKVNTLPFL